MVVDVLVLVVGELVMEEKREKEETKIRRNFNWPRFWRRKTILEPDD